MRKRAELFAHIQNTRNQYNPPDPLGCIAKPKNREGIVQRFDDPSVQKSMSVDLEVIEAYDHILTQPERDIIACAKEHHMTSYALLQTIPGVGRILGLVLLYEIESIERFPQVQDFVSYCRLIKSIKESNGKKYGSSGKKIGNAHLKWAFSEAAVLFLKGNEPGKKYPHQRLAHKHGKAKALSILAHPV